MEQAGRKVNMVSPAALNQYPTTAHDTTACSGPSTLIPQKSDVLLGRGRGREMHSGNLRYKGKHKLCCNRILDYFALPRAS